MKTVLVSAFALLLSFATFGQDIRVLEYFIDTDAGFGKNKLVSVMPAADGPFSFTVDVSAASIGYHILYMRTRDSNGHWSHTTARNVEVIRSQETGNVVSAEYFFDTDPGVGKAVPTTLVTRADGSLAFTIPASSTKPGAHVLYIRAKDSPNRNWSLTQSKAVTIVNCTPPDQPATVASQTVCAGSVVPFNVTATAQATGYRWAVPSGWTIVSGQGTSSVMLKAPDVTAATNFTTLTVSAYNSCDTSQVRTFSATVNPIPAKPTIKGTDTLLTSSVATGNQWFRNGAVISGATGQTYRPSAAGQYTVQITQNGCTSPFSEAYSIVVTATIEPVLSDVQVFPNPIADRLTVINKSHSPVRVQLYSLTGQPLISKEGITNTYQMNTGRLAAGGYILLVADENHVMRKLIIKE